MVILDSHPTPLFTSLSLKLWKRSRYEFKSSWREFVGALPGPPTTGAPPRGPRRVGSRRFSLSDHFLRSSRLRFPGGNPVALISASSASMESAPGLLPLYESRARH